MARRSSAPPPQPAAARPAPPERAGGGVPVPLAMAKAWRPYGSGQAGGAAIYLHEPATQGKGYSKGRAREGSRHGHASCPTAFMQRQQRLLQQQQQ
jgi:hypothetical protein